MYLRSESSKHTWMFDGFQGWNTEIYKPLSLVSLGLVFLGALDSVDKSLCVCCFAEQGIEREKKTRRKTGPSTIDALQKIVRPQQGLLRVGLVRVKG